jgi:hypothetical protein
MKHERRLEIFLAIGLILAFCLTGMWLLRVSTPFGLGLNTDSVYYVNGARNILAGNGFYRNSGEDILKPLTHFPPLFADVLSLVGLTGMDPLRGGRLVIILLYGVNSLLFAWLAWKLTRNCWLAVAGAFLMSFSSVNLRQYSWLMSEPLYLFLMLISILIAWEYFKGWKLWPVPVLGLLSGLMYLTRYVGLSLLVTWLTVFLLLTPGWRKKAVHAGLFLLTSLPFVIGIMARNYALTGSTGNRNFILHWAPFEKVATGIRNLWGWVLPTGTQMFYDQLEWVFIALFFILALFLLVVLVRHLLRVVRGETISRLKCTLLMLGLHVVIYLGSIYVAMNFFDATTVFDDRMLLPVYMITVLFVLEGIGIIWQRGRKDLRLSIAAGSLVILGFALAGAIKTGVMLSKDGQGFIDHYRRESATLQYIRDHATDLIYTNAPPTVYIQTGLSSYMVPSPIDSLTLQARASYEEDLAEMKTKINAQDGLLVFFYEPGYETNYWYLDLTAGLVPLENLPDGIIWGRVD